MTEPAPKDSNLKLFCLIDFGRCLDSILHAEHKRILEEMRADYSDSNSMEHKQGIQEPSEQAVANGPGSDSKGISGIDGFVNEETEAENPIPFDYVEGLRKLLGSTAKDVKRYHILEPIRSVYSLVLLTNSAS